jgi:hypothetical protein
MEMVGHRTEAICRRYAIVDSNMMRNMMREIKGVTHALRSVSTPRCSNELRRPSPCRRSLVPGGSTPDRHDTATGFGSRRFRPEDLAPGGYC